MRFWRRQVPNESGPNEPTPDADTLPPATDREAVRPQPDPAPAPEPERPRGWFGWRRGGPTETVPTETITAPEPELPIPEPEPEPSEPPAPELEPTDTAEPEPAESEPAEPEPAEPARAAFEPPPPEPVIVPEPASPPLPEAEPLAPAVETLPEAHDARGLFGWRRGDAPEPAITPEPAPTIEPPPPEPAVAPQPAPAPSFLAPPPPAAAPAPQAAEARGWFARLRDGLSRSSTRLNEGINTIFARRRLDAAALEELEELLIASDMGTGVAGEVVERLRGSRFNQEVAPEEVREALAEEIIKLIEWVQKPLRPDPAKKPFVILVIGVNGSGKTTTIGKLAKQYRDAGRNVILAAGDTFRAAAVEQLQIWGERAGCPVVTRPTGSDSAGLAYDALEKARAEKADLLLIDTAGRLHNKADLMGELQKIVRVLKKLDPEAPHSVLLVLDATVGQNAHAQAETFRDMIGVTGLVMTKLDGTAKGGVLVSLTEKYGIPIHAIGIGETAEDLRPFDARAYARSLVGLGA